MPPSRRLPQGQPQYDIAGMLGNGAWGYLVGIYDKDAGPDNQRLYPNGARVAQMSDTLPIDLNSAALGIGRHVSGIADPFNGHIDEFRIAHVQRSDGWIETTWNNMSDPGAFAVAGAEEQDGGNGEPPPLAGAGVVVCLMGEGQRSGRQESSTAGSRSLDEADVPFFGALGASGTDAMVARWSAPWRSREARAAYAGQPFQKASGVAQITEFGSSHQGCGLVMRRKSWWRMPRGDRIAPPRAVIDRRFLSWLLRTWRPGRLRIRSSTNCRTTATGALPRRVISAKGAS